MSLILALALAVAPAKTEPAQDGTPISGTLQGLISADDYPPEAVKREQEGSVAIRVTVDEKGAVADCEVIESSGFPSLDTQTCRIVWQRAKFAPGKDKQGRPRGGSTTTTITWRLAPLEPLPSQPWSRREIAAFDKDGKVAPCRVEREGAPEVPASVFATKCHQELGSALSFLSATKPGVAAFIVEQRFYIGSAGNSPIGPDDLLIAREVATLEVNAAGKIVSCQTSERFGPFDADQTCPSLSKNAFVPRVGPDGTPAPFKATIGYWAYGKVEKPVSAAPSGSSRKR